MQDASMTIDHVAERAGVATSAICYYVRRGLLAANARRPPGREHAGDAAPAGVHSDAWRGRWSTCVPRRQCTRDTAGVAEERPRPLSPEGMLQLTAELERLSRQHEATRMSSLASGLAADLRRAARTTAVDAVLGAVGEDEADAVLKAGMALEYMAKSYLAGLHPALIADNDLTSLVLLTGNGHRLRDRQSDLTAVHTITATEACRRVAVLSRSRWTFTKDDAKVLHGRNAVAHLAAVTYGSVEPLVARMVELIDGIRALDDEPQSQDDFWGDAHPAVLAILARAPESRNASLEAKFAAARSRLRAQFGGMSEMAAERVMQLLEEAHTSEWNEWLELPIHCPVCGRVGWVEYELERGVSHETPSGLVYDEESDYRTAYAVEFTCAVCRLELDAAELQLAGMPDLFEVPPETMLIELVPNAWSEAPPMPAPEAEASGSPPTA